MKKLLAIMLALIMVLCMLPSVAFAEGTDTGKAIQNGASGISGYDSTNGYDYIYYGTWNSSPIKWRVLDTKTNMENATKGDGLFLLSDVLLEKVPFQEHYHDAYGSHHKGPGSNSGDHANCLKANAWQGSDAQKWCGSFYNTSLTSQEQGAVLPTTKSDKYLYVSGSTGPFYSYNFAASQNILNEDRVFFLSAEEAINSTYGFINNDDAKDNARIAKYDDAAYGWWLRSPCVYTFDPGCVNSYGLVSHNNAHHKFAARPAFNLDLNSVLFTSSATENGKPGGGLEKVPEYTGNEWKLTLKDSSRAGFSVLSAYMVGDSLKISYSGAKTGANEYISVVVKDNNGSITHYGRSASSLTDANGVATIEGMTMTAMQEGTLYLYAFNEQYNGDKKTDYASELKPVTIVDAPTVTDFTKARLTDMPTQDGFDTPNNMEFNFDGEVIFTDTAPKANLLYSFTVKGTPGAEVEIEDDGAKFFYRGNWGDSPVTVALPTAEQGATQAELTLYGYKEFSSGDINGGMLKNTAKATAAANSREASVKVAAKGQTGPQPSADPNPSTPPTPGGGNGGGYYYPTTTPVPVIVIPPKTGDMTVWQSILHFLGIR